MGNDDDITFTLDSHTYDVTLTSNSDITYTIPSLTSDDTITLDLDSSTWASDGSTYTTNNVDFVDAMPSLWKIKDMCKHYPALEKAFENFKTVYTMVQQDYKGNHEDDEEIPF